MVQTLVAIGALTVAVITCVPAVFAAPAQLPDLAAAEDPGYVIGPEDILDIAVWDNEQLTRTVPVRPDGKISLPLLNDVAAAGYTPMQLRDILAEALVTYIPVPTVSVIVREVHSFKVTVIGEVKTPGRLELKSRSTVLEVLAMAGGFTEFAARNRVVVLRRTASGTRRIPFAFEKLAAADADATPESGARAGHVEHNFEVVAGDIVVVP
jgi:polysaccharide export outer membrane protein